MSTRYRKFPSLDNPSFSKNPVNQQILRNLKGLYDEHSKDWDRGTRYAIIDHVLNGDTEVTERISLSPHRHKLLNRNMTFAIWIVLRATYGFSKVVRLKHRLIMQYPGIDPESLVSPLLENEAKSSALEEGYGTSQVARHREPSIFGPVGVSQFSYQHQQQSAPPKRKQLEVVDHQPWKLPNKKIKHEEDTTAFSNTALSSTALPATLRSSAFQKTSLLPVVQEGHSTTSAACNAPLPSIESPGGPSNSGQNTFHDSENEENCDPSLQTSLHSPAQALDSSQSVSTTEMSGSQSANSSATHFTPLTLIQQNQHFNAQLHALRSEVDQLKKERDVEHQGLIKVISSLRDEIRAVKGKVLTKASKVDTALTEYNNAARALRTSLDSLAVELDEKKDQEKPLQDLATTVHTMKSSMVAVETYFDPQQQKFQDNMKALGTMG
ncbi:uncharacterized protein B0J16DRAFT_394686 [Fusarium flagelliforme]|nr:uncharacterized protein B0J16DRAFT_394686 [Fusarium flagelliforme]KAH7192695.1 hypothetical protein B0J16DRAFT_394686 [Fusarium flagelliforme]